MSHSYWLCIPSTKSKCRENKHCENRVLAFSVLLGTRIRSATEHKYYIFFKSFQEKSGKKINLFLRRKLKKISKGQAAKIRNRSGLKVCDV